MRQTTLLVTKVAFFEKKKLKFYKLVIAFNALQQCFTTPQNKKGKLLT